MVSYNLEIAVWAMKRDGRYDLIDALASYGAIPMQWAEREPVVIDSTASESPKRLEEKRRLEFLYAESTRTD